MSVDDRKLRFHGEELGTLPFKTIFKMATKGEIDSTAEFFSERRGSWLPLRSLLADTGVAPEDRVGQFLNAQVSTVRYRQGSADDCPICKSLDGERFSTNDVPSIPPDGCTCFPYCSCFLVAELDDDD